MNVYSPRNPKTSPLYRLVEDYHETFINRYDELYLQQYGFWRPIIRDVLYKFLDCGNLHQGFARVRCDACGSEYLLAFSCKTRCFCPSCNQRRSLEFGELIADKILGDVPVKTCTFTIPKMLRPYFKFDHKLYSKLCRCAYETILEFFQLIFESEDILPGVVIAIHSFGNLLNHHPHLHGIITDGCFDKDGKLYLLPEIPDNKEISDIFGLKVLEMMMKENKITKVIAEKIMGWHHSGFNVHFGGVISPQNRNAQETAARYLARPPISLENMTYLPEEGKVIYGKP
ncbi:MAG: transposase zinc-binding domain-containing protein, partial [Armatimonadota bacterium]